MLESYLRERGTQRGLLLMTHIVLGYPSFEVGRRLVATMVEAGVDVVELQIPFSEPIADGPVILRANQAALARGSRVEECLEFAAEMARVHPIPFVIMSYYNPIFRHGVGRFVDRMRDAGLRGAIVPDLPPEEGTEYLAAMAQAELAPIFIFSPTTSPERMRELDQRAQGFVYCVARRGVTGARTSFSAELDAYLARCRAATRLPLALGFGVKSREDFDYLRGKVELGVVGSETLRVLEAQGVEAVGPFVRALRG